MGAQVYSWVGVRVTVRGGLSVRLRGALSECVSLCLWVRGHAGAWVFRYVGKKAGDVRRVAVKMSRCVRGQEEAQVRLCGLVNKRAYGCKEVQVDTVCGCLDL